MRSGFLFTFLLAIQTSFSQQLIRGRVIDSDTHAPLAGVNIVIKDGTTGTVSDPRGQFLLHIGGSPVTLRFLYYGYPETDSSLAAGAYHTILLKTTTPRPVDFAPPGNQSNVSLRPVIITPAAYDDPAQLLQSRVPGLLMARCGSNPNENYTLRIRGLNGSLLSDPLIWIDGMPGGGLSMLNPEDIHEIAVLQEAASTARYGAGAQAGVVSVQTQPYRMSDWGWQLDYRAQLSISNVVRPLKPLTAEEFLAGNGRDMMPGGESTYWPEQITRAAFSQFHHLALAYSGAKLQCRGSFGFQDRDGILLYSGYKQYRGMADATYTFWDDRIRLRGQWIGNLRQANLSEQSAFHYAVSFNPTFSIRSADSIYSQFGTYTQFPALASNHFFNPVALLEQNKNLAETRNWRGMLRADIKLLDDLSLSGGWSQSEQQYGFGEYSAPESLFRGWPNGGFVNMGIDNSGNRYWEGLLRYQKSCARQRFTLETGLMGQRLHLDGVQYQGADITPRHPDIRGLRDILQLNIGSNDLDSIQHLRYDSIFGNRGLLIQVTHEYGKRWQLTAGLRGLQWQYAGMHFPATVLPYFRGAFNFLGGKNNLQRHTLILRASWAKTANAYIPYPSVVAHWNDKRELGLGLDAGARRWAIQVDWFQNRVHDFYEYYPDPYLESVDINNSGWHCSLRADIIQRPRFDWQSDLNISILKTKYETFSRPGEEFYSHAHFSYSGGRWGEIRTFEKDGIINGVVRFKDKNGNGMYDDADLTKQGLGVPSIWLGWNNDLHWKRWKLNASFRYTHGHVLINEYRVFYEINPQYQIVNSLQTRYYQSQQLYSANMFNEHVEKAAYFRCDALQLTYEFTSYKVGCRQFWQVFAGAQNLFTWSRYTGNDPEVRLTAAPYDFDIAPVRKNNPRAPGIDRPGSYWLERAFYAGIKLSLNVRRKMICDSALPYPE